MQTYAPRPLATSSPEAAEPTELAQRAKQERVVQSELSADDAFGFQHAPGCLQPSNAIRFGVLTEGTYR